LALITPLVTAWLVLLLMYSLLPNTHVSARMAALGSFVGAVLWVAAIQLFSIYVQRAAISTLYGALGLLPLSLFWMWINWMIILFGLELTYALQMMREGRFRHGYEQARDEVVIDRMLLLPLATRVAVAFREGEAATVESLSRDLFLPDRAVTRMMRALREAGLIHEVASRRREGFTLARPADKIMASEVLAASESLLPSMDVEVGHQAWTLVDRLNQCMSERTGKTTLADLAQADPATS
jgi:membrane protein